MITSLKQIKNRIRSIENTKKVTNAMQMVSVSKLNRIHAALSPLKSYFANMDSLLNRFISGASSAYCPLLEERAEKKAVGLCLITSDSGLCGMYNNNIIRTADEFTQGQGADKIKLFVVGKKGFNYFSKQGISISNSYIGLNGRYSGKIADEISDNLISGFLSKEIDEVYVAYTAYDTTSRRRPVLKKFLNIEPAAGEEIRYIMEPNDKGEILKALIPKYISVKMKIILLESFAAEHMSRAIAMKTATENAEELVEELVLMRNKLRQATITQDIMEIISAGEALKG